MGSESINNAVEDEEEIMHFVTLGMFIIGTSVSITSALASRFWFTLNRTRVS